MRTGCQLIFILHCLSLQHTLNPLDCTVEQLLVDIKLQKGQQVKYPGACALEYHITIQIVMECLFGWDKKK